MGHWYPETQRTPLIYYLMFSKGFETIIYQSRTHDEALVKKHGPLTCDSDDKIHASNNAQEHEPSKSSASLAQS